MTVSQWLYSCLALSKSFFFCAQWDRSLHLADRVLWGSQLELADELKMGRTFSQASPASSSALMPDPKVRSAASSDLTESMLLAWTTSEELDVTRVEADVMSESVFFLAPTYEELVGVMTRAMAKWKFDWLVEREETLLSRLDEQFLAGHRHPWVISMMSLRDRWTNHSHRVSTPL